MCAPNASKGTTLGGFSEYVHVLGAKKDVNLFVLDDKISDEEASLIEPLSVGWHAALRTNPHPGQNAIVWGAGCIGAGAAMCLKYKGCEKIMVVDRGAMRLNVIKDLGFETCSTNDENWRKQIMDYFGQQ